MSRSGEHPAYFHGLLLTQSGRFRARLLHPNESGSELTSPVVPLGVWVHVAMVVDVAAGQLHLYLDGLPVPGSPRPLSDVPLVLWPEIPRDDRSGAYFLASGVPDRGAGSFYDAYFQGALADVRFYRRALSAAEILVVGQE